MLVGPSLGGQEPCKLQQHLNTDSTWKTLRAAITALSPTQMPGTVDLLNESYWRTIFICRSLFRADTALLGSGMRSKLWEG